MFRIYPYKTGSKSVKKLKEKLDALVIRLEGSKYKPREGHMIINWGNSHRPAWMTDDVHKRVINTPETVAIASDKLATLEVLANAGIATVKWTTSKVHAIGWVMNGHKVFVRHKLCGHSGDGIEVIEQEAHKDIEFLVAIADGLYERKFDELAYEVDKEIEMVHNDMMCVPDAPLYTLGVMNAGEYRVHVFGDEVILYQKKSRRINEDGEVETAEGMDADVRNLESNWVYRTGNLKRLERVENLAIDAIKAVGLDFGAVDIIMEEGGHVYVLEINSAPGLGNQDTLDAYAEGFKYN